MDKMKKKVDNLNNFVETVLNDNNKHFNAVTYLVDGNDKYTDIQVVFNRDHRKQYAELLRFCADNGFFVIIETHPMTLATTVRMWGSVYA